MTKLLKYSDKGVDVKLVSFYNPGPDTVYWSKQYNSYVCVKDDDGLWVTQKQERCRIYSVNGIGEIRWEVMMSPISEEYKEAAAHFGLEIRS